jgi:hypothetical protein
MEWILIDCSNITKDPRTLQSFDQVAMEWIPIEGLNSNQIQITLQSLNQAQMEWIPIREFEFTRNPNNIAVSCPSCDGIDPDRWVPNKNKAQVIAVI